MAAKLRLMAVGVFALAANAVGLLPVFAGSSDEEALAMCKSQNSLCFEGGECCSEVCEIENFVGRCQGGS
jgi:predicted RNA methylase